MDELILHVGYHKSASTFLQRRFFPELPVNYQLLGDSDPRVLNMLKGPGPLDPEWLRSGVDDLITRSAVDPVCPTTVLSQEGLCGRPAGGHSPCKFEIAERLKRVFPAAKILIVVRNQFDYMSSLYTFRVASKGVVSSSFDNFLARRGPEGLFEHLEYDRLVARYQDLFGRDRVLVLPMEMLGEDSEEMAHAMCRFLDVPEFSPEDTLAVNASSKSLFILNFWRPFNFAFKYLLRLLIWILRRGEDRGRLAGLRYGYFRFKKRVSGWLTPMFRRGRQLDVRCYRDYEGLRKRFGAANARLVRLTGIDLERYGYPLDADSS